MNRRFRRRPTIEALEDLSMFAGVEVEGLSTDEIVALESSGDSLTEAVYSSNVAIQPTENPDGASIQDSALLSLASDYTPAPPVTPTNDDSLPSECPEAEGAGATATIVGVNGNVVQISTPNGEIVSASSTAGDVIVTNNDGISQLETPDGAQDQHVTVNTSNGDGETTSTSVYLSGE